jgi:hypothetical protein
MRLGNGGGESRERNYKQLLPIGIRVHLTGDQEMGVEGEGYARVVWNARPLRHMLCCLIFL